MDNAELAALRDEALASCAGFNRKDAAAWLDPFHADAVTYNRGFMAVDVVRPMAEQVLAASKSFNLVNIDGRIVDDTAILFGDYRYELADAIETGKFSATYVRSNGAWECLLTHYTPSE